MPKSPKDSQETEKASKAKPKSAPLPKKATKTKGSAPEASQGSADTGKERGSHPRAAPRARPRRRRRSPRQLHPKSHTRSSCTRGRSHGGSALVSSAWGGGDCRLAFGGRVVRAAVGFGRVAFRGIGRCGRAGRRARGPRRSRGRPRSRGADATSPVTPGPPLQAAEAAAPRGARSRSSSREPSIRFATYP